jgi:hypothetical protein
LKKISVGVGDYAFKELLYRRVGSPIRVEEGRL